MHRWISTHIQRCAVILLTLAMAYTYTVSDSAADTYAVPQTAEVILAWDANDPAPDGYRVYQRLDGQAYDYTQPVWVGSAITCTIYNLAYDSTYFFVVRAYVGDSESSDSNEISYTTVSSLPQTTYTIRSSASPNGSITPAGTTTVDEGADQTFGITPDSGCHIVDVLVDGVSVGAVSTYTFQQVTADHSISVEFAFSSHTISAMAESGGSISPSGMIDVEHAAAQSFTITPAVGYQVADVYVDGISVGAVSSYLFDAVGEDHTIRAIFTAQTFSISASADSNGTITPVGTSSVFYGGSQTYYITPNSGCLIEDVLVDGVSVGDSATYTFTTVKANHTIHAVFAVENQPPVADAGPDQSVTENSTVILSGLNSLDPDDGIAAFQWRQIQGVEVALSASDEPEIHFTAPNVGISGAALVFEVTVTDYSGAAAVDSCIVNVTWVNLAPEANAGADQTVAEGSLVTIDASNSMDADDGIVSYAWKQVSGPAVKLSDAADAVPTFQAPDVGTDGTSMTFEVTVTDAGGLQDTDTCLVNVSWVNTPPVADAGADQQVAGGDEVTLDGTQSFDTDSDDLLSCRWRQTGGIPVELSDATARAPIFIAPDGGDTGSLLTFELTVEDSQGLSGSDTCQVRVAPEAPPQDTIAPVVSVENPSGDLTMTFLRKLSLSGSATDNVEVDRVVWQNSTGDSGVAMGTTNWSIDYVRLKRGENRITITAYDTSGNTASVTKTVFLIRLR